MAKKDWKLKGRKPVRHKKIKGLIERLTEPLGIDTDLSSAFLETATFGPGDKRVAVLLAKFILPPPQSPAPRDNTDATNSHLKGPYDKRSTDGIERIDAPLSYAEDEPGTSLLPIRPNHQLKGARQRDPQQTYAQEENLTRGLKVNTLS